MSVKQKAQVVQQLKEWLEGREEIIFSYLHGSFVEEKHFRDIDVAVFVDERRVEADRALEYGLDVGTQLDMSFGLPIDIRVLNYTSLGFRYHASQGRLLTCRDDDLRVEIVTRIWSLYFDQLPLKRRFLQDRYGES